MRLEAAMHIVDSLAYGKNMFSGFRLFLWLIFGSPLSNIATLHLEQQIIFCQHSLYNFEVDDFQVY